MRNKIKNKIEGLTYNQIYALVLISLIISGICLISIYSLSELR